MNNIEKLKIINSLLSMRGKYPKDWVQEIADYYFSIEIKKARRK
jgi:hypothetical protein